MYRFIVFRPVDTLSTGDLARIFPEDVSYYDREEPNESIWSKLQEHHLGTLYRRAPNNAFEEMIIWTEQNKLWKFPINNEYGMFVLD